MATLEQHHQTMLNNIPEKTGKTLAQWLKILKAENFEKHGQIVKFLKTEHGVTHGFANLIASESRGATPGKVGDTDLVAAQYAGKKAHLKPIHDAVVKYATSLGKDVEVLPRKTSVSLRRKKQFALISPATQSRVDLGLALKGEPVTDRLEAGNAMTSHKVHLEDAKSVDAELKRWLKQAYTAAG
ncbi:MAG: DUF4287 domain-containing protein [Pseudomonadota bacterium]